MSKFLSPFGTGQRNPRPSRNWTPEFDPEVRPTLRVPRVQTQLHSKAHYTRSSLRSTWTEIAHTRSDLLQDGRLSTFFLTYSMFCIAISLLSAFCHSCRRGPREALSKNAPPPIGHILPTVPFSMGRLIYRPPQKIADAAECRWDGKPGSGDSVIVTAAYFS